MSSNFFQSAAGDVSELDNVTPDNLFDALQQAIGIEIATIPLYLYTYYSINREPDQNAISEQFYTAMQSQQEHPRDLIDRIAQLDGYCVLDEDFRRQLLKVRDEPYEGKDTAYQRLALLLGAAYSVYVNKLAAFVYSVVVEEMLHTSLAANVLSGLQLKGSATTGAPKLYGADILPTWPFKWVGHEPPVELRLSPLTKDQLFDFLKVETPTKLPGTELQAQAIPFTTIGEFYQSIIDCMEKENDQGHLSYQLDAPQLAPGNSYYAPNNINSIYYDTEHKPTFTNSDSGGYLIAPMNFEEAKRAMQMIMDQGEGLKDEIHWDGETIDCSDLNARRQNYIDDGKELPHFIKFMECHCLLTFLEGLETMFALNLRSHYVFDNPCCPTAKTYEQDPVAAAIDRAASAAFSYVFLMLDHCYRPGSDQAEIFTSIHKSMMWVISTLCQDLMNQVTCLNKTKILAPTFQFVDLTASKADHPRRVLEESIEDAILVVNREKPENAEKLCVVLDHVLTRVKTLVEVTA